MRRRPGGPGAVRALGPLLLVLIAALAPAAGRAATVRVAAASNLKPALERLAPAFEAAHPGQVLQVTYGASGKLYAQALHGAPFDVFLSADDRYPGALAEAGRTEGGPFVYAEGILVVWTPRDAPAPDPAAPLAVLTRPEIRRIAIANPALAPYGAAAQAALEEASLTEALEPKLVFGENVSQTAHFVYSGAAQAGLLPLSLAASPKLRAAGRHVRLPTGAHPPIRQAGVVLQGPHTGAARLFVGFLLGEAGREILSEAGYERPPRPAPARPPAKNAAPGRRPGARD